jgi:hypothetical protein
MPYPSTPCGRVTPETTLWPFQGRHACWAGCLQPSSTPLHTPRQVGHRTPYACEGNQNPLSFVTLVSFSIHVKLIYCMQRIYAFLRNWAIIVPFLLLLLPLSSPHGLCFEWLPIVSAFLTLNWLGSRLGCSRACVHVRARGVHAECTQRAPRSRWLLRVRPVVPMQCGADGCHDQADAEWIVI